MFNTLIPKLVALQQATNQVEQTETINLLKSRTEQLQDEHATDALYILSVLQLALKHVDGEFELP
jgi:hypothetical protein